jgi:hypothetical protein
MSHIHWVARQNKLEKPNDEEKIMLFIIYRERTERTKDKTLFLLIYYESTKRELQTKYICGCRCYERLQTKTNEFTCLSYTELVLELEHLKIETRLITEMFVNVMGECEN